MSWLMHNCSAICFEAFQHYTAYWLFFWFDLNHEDNNILEVSSWSKVDDSPLSHNKKEIDLETMRI